MFEYERLIAFKKAKGFYVQIRPLISSKNSLMYFEKDQLGRSALSVVANIAEGNGTHSSKAKANYFRISRGSISEAAAILSVLFDCDILTKADYSNLHDLAGEISKILYSLMRKSTS